MRYAFVPLVLGLGANAFVARSSTQCYKLKASGGAKGILGQLDDGQNRIGDHLPTGCYCLCDGGFTDSEGRGCILTPPTTQFQCDVGASPTGGFAVGSNGGVTYNGDDTFYACPVNDYGVYNVYSKPVAGQDKCVKITLETAGSCGASSTPSPAPKPSPKPSPQPSPQPSSQPHPEPKPSPEPSKHCPEDLNGNYQYPHLIVPVNSQHPDQAYGTQYNGKINNHTCTIFNFDIPSSYAGKTCSTIFLLPEKADLETSDYTISGSGYCTFTKLKGNADEKTTWNNQPAVDGTGHALEITPGGSWTVDTFDCPAGQRISFEMCTNSDFSLDYFQDYNPSPIGMYVRQC